MLLGQSNEELLELKDDDENELECEEDEELKETIDLDNLQRVIDSLEDQIEELKDSL